MVIQHVFVNGEQMALIENFFTDMQFHSEFGLKVT
jgi:hypothetical protein